MDNDRLVALKILRKEWIWNNEMSDLVRREIEIMKGEGGRETVDASRRYLYLADCAGCR